MSTPIRPSAPPPPRTRPGECCRTAPRAVDLDNLAIRVRAAERERTSRRAPDPTKSDAGFRVVALLAALDNKEPPGL
ncbi:hypothetical protein ACFV7R_42430 [Streptomyces sp. NPDC059866]|uniref:hypothetical protein n=1 Tax=Streptomyces sp. NPDC059866 TaxID=3346978 RepID=UPI00364F9242